MTPRGRRSSSAADAGFVIATLAKHHASWHRRHRKQCPFNYDYLRTFDPALLSAIERPDAGIGGIQNAFELAGINPFCHLTGIAYARKGTDEQRKARFLQIVRHLLLEAGGADQLNDNTINDARTFLPPSSLRRSSSYPVCEARGCPLLPLSFCSVYAQGRRLFGSWNSALAAAGFHYERIRRRKPTYPRAEVMKDLLRFARGKKGRFSLQELRNQNHALYSGMHHSHCNSPFAFAHLSVIETALVELHYLRQRPSRPGLSPEAFYRTHGIDALRHRQPLRKVRNKPTLLHWL